MDQRNPVALLEMKFFDWAGDTDEAKRYHGAYGTVSPEQSPRGLLLGLRIADVTGDQDALSSYELALRNVLKVTRVPGLDGASESITRARFKAVRGGQWP